MAPIVILVTAVFPVTFEISQTRRHDKRSTIPVDPMLKLIILDVVDFGARLLRTNEIRNQLSETTVGICLPNHADLGENALDSLRITHGHNLLRNNAGCDW